MKPIEEMINSEPWNKFFQYLEPLPFEERHRFIGGTALATVIGVNPYMTQFELWNIMVNNVEPQRSIFAEKKMKAGKKLEKVILEYFEEEFKPDELLYFSDYNVTFKSKIYDYIAGTPDAICIRDGKSYVVELKNMGFKTAKEFKDGNIPIQYLCQANLYAELLGTDYYIYGVLIDGYDFNIFGPFERDPEFVKSIIKSANDFVEKYIKTKKPPEPSTLKEVSVLYPISQPKKLVATSKIYQHYLQSLEIQNKIKELEKQLDKHKKEIAAFLGEFEELIYNNKPIVRFKTIKSNRFDSKKFQKDHPELYEIYLDESLFRRFELLDQNEE